MNPRLVAPARWGEEFLGALQVAAKNNPQGLQFLMADHLRDEQALASLLTHFSATLDSDEAGGMAMAILLRRPLPEQLEHWCCLTLTMTGAPPGRRGDGEGQASSPRWQ